MGNDLLSIIKEKKQQIVALQAELDAAIRELTDEGIVSASHAAQAVRATRSGLARRRQRGMRGSAQPAPRRRKRSADSTLAWSEAVIKETGHDLHVNDIIQKIEQKFHKRVKKTTLVGNLARRVKAHDTFTRTAPNTYGLLEFRKEKQLKFG